MANYGQVSYGSKGDDVIDLQELLNNNGYNLSVDGDFGVNTQAAVKDYQQKNGLAVDGIVGTNTWGALTRTQTPAAQAPEQTEPAVQQEAPNTPTSASTPFTESDAAKQAYALVQQHLAQKPGEHQSTWGGELKDTIAKILNREKFSYDLNGDAMYQQYKDQYVNQGKLAMMDTMGQAAAMTGGFGNSYAQSVGQQAYQGYLQQLNDKVPELYGMALDQYNREGQALYDQASLLAGMEEQEYSRYRDKLSDYYTELDRLTGDYRYLTDQEYGKWADDRAYDYQVGQDAYNKQNNAYDKLTSLMAIGYQPTDEELAAAGMTREQANAIASAYTTQATGSTGSTSVGSSTSRKTGNTYTANPGWDKEKIIAFQNAHGLTPDGIWGPLTAAEYDKDSGWEYNPVPTYDSIVDDLNTYIKNGASKSEINSYLRGAYQEGYISQKEYSQLKEQFAPRGNTY